jgi:predicted transcriptional regulator
MEQFDNQPMVAKKLKISQQAVSKASRSPIVEDLLKGDRSIQDFLNKSIQP